MANGGHTLGPQIPGEFGGVVIRRFSGDGRVWQGGDRVPALVTRRWKPQNRTVLDGTYIEFYKTRQPDERRFTKQWLEQQGLSDQDDEDGQPAS